MNAQQKTGYHSYAMQELHNVGAVDYAALSARVSGTAADMATCRNLLSGLKDLAQYIIEENENWLARQDQPINYDAEYAAYYIDVQARSQLRNCISLLHEVDSWQQKASIVIQGLFNLIAQRDQNVNIGIARDSHTLARESKKDNTSMKAIAAVTMCFLPGTFAAVSTPDQSREAA